MPSATTLSLIRVDRDERRPRDKCDEGIYKAHEGKVVVIDVVRSRSVRAGWSRRTQYT